MVELFRGELGEALIEDGEDETLFDGGFVERFVLEGVVEGLPESASGRKPISGFFGERALVNGFEGVAPSLGGVEFV